MRVKIPKTLMLYFLLILTFSFGCKEEGLKKSESQNPNIVIIIADDLGWLDVGYHGSEVKTPNMDKLARTGIRLEHHYAMPTCTPTRVSLMTGKYPSRYGITGPDYGEVIDLGDTTLASVLKDHGYFTAIVGKWHLGSPPYTPLKYGFMSSYGYFDGQIDPYTHEYKTETELTSRKSWHRNDEYLEEEGHVTDLLTDEAIRIIEQEREDPFFLYVAHHVPHYPLDEPDRWMSLYDGLAMHPSRRLFAASVSHMDEGIGKITEALERSGKRENTLVLVFSDNGGQHSWHSNIEYRGKYADKPHSVLGNNFPLRGWKGDLYEGGIRVPAIANWPGKLKPGAAVFPVHMSDWLPTLCHVIGAENYMEDLQLDGKNIWPFLTGNQKMVEDRSIYWKTDQGYAIREGQWKLLMHRNSGQSELYNLEHDFRETKDISASHPEKVEQLETLINEFRKEDR